jgi:glutaminase
MHPRPLPSRDALRHAADTALAAGRSKLGEGAVATYIPELAKADPRHLGLAIATVDGQQIAVGDADVPFTLQSASKPFALARVLDIVGDALFEKVGVEPSGDAFNSIVKLEQEQGRPRNPLINAGALVVCGYLPGPTAGDRIAGLQRFFADVSGGAEYPVHEPTWRSEEATGYRNRALANFMRQYGVLGETELALDTYFRQSAMQATARTLARLALFLAHRGVDPGSGTVALTPQHNRTVLALMATCGLYDEAGRFATRVGLPAKSAVSGAIVAVVPGTLAIAAYSPALNARGNSVAGAAALAHLTEALGLSVFG